MNSDVVLILFSYFKSSFSHTFTAVQRNLLLVHLITKLLRSNHSISFPPQTASKSPKTLLTCCMLQGVSNRSVHLFHSSPLPFTLQRRTLCYACINEQPGYLFPFSLLPFQLHSHKCAFIAHAASSTQPLNSSARGFLRWSHFIAPDPSSTPLMNPSEGTC
uniref:(northern house mosquito) hypothetical protein n=1 Tax=Culex pipiens TaxID=7175 RepID=A0A8D8BQF2_CULPI